MTEDGGMAREPDMNDPAQVFVDRAIKALYAEFAGDDHLPRFFVAVEMPPDGRIGIATSADDEVDAHLILSLAAASVRSAMSPADRKRARDQWGAMRAGFARRN